jgi:hypothetical protein
MPVKILSARQDELNLCPSLYNHESSKRLVASQDFRHVQAFAKSAWMVVHVDFEIPGGAVGLCYSRRCPSQGRGVRSLKIRIYPGLILLLFVVAVSALAQTPAKPLRFDFTPIVGYRTGMSVSTASETVNPTSNGIFKIAVDSSPAFGAAFGARIDEENLIEFRWTRMNSTMHAEPTSVFPFQQDVVIDQYHGDFSHEYIVDNWPIQVRPFILASVGATHFSGSVTRNFTRFSFGIGGGAKFYINRNVGLRLQAEWLPVLINPNVDLACGSACVIRVKTQLASQGQFSVGPLFRF